MHTPSATTISAALITSYENALYSFEYKGRTVPLRIGQRCPELRELMLATKSAEAFCITAWNPFSLQRTAQENEAAQVELCAALDALEAIRLPATGESADGSWAPEPGMLVLNISRAQVVELGNRFGQNALLSISADGLTSLLLLR